jgi:uncharacterized membrane protein YczE
MAFSAMLGIAVMSGTVVFVQLAGAIRAVEFMALA